MYYKHLKSVLSKYGCDRILEDARKFEFTDAPIDFYGISEVKGDIRNNERAEFEHMLLAEYLHHKIKVADNYNFPNKINRFEFEKVGSHFRLYKYSEGQFFKPHKDGHILAGELESQVTVLVYLNDTEAGETVLMPNGPKDKDSYVIIQPKAGDVLMFEHGIWHEGRPVTSGNKYVLRTDLFYSFDMFAK